MFFKLSALFLSVVLSSAIVQAYPKAPPRNIRFQLPPYFTANYNFEGIVGLNNCSGSLIRLENSRETDKALVLTNGHCLEFGFPPPGKFVYGKPSRRQFQLFDAGGNVKGVLTATTVVYSTMTKTDMTLYKLQETYQEIFAKSGVRPMLLASQHPAVSEPIEIISGYWRRGYRCNIETFVNKLVEGGWTCEDSVRYSRPGCETIGGTSGSPIIRAGTRIVIGVNNTGNESGEKCTENNPCEVDQNGKVFYQKGFSYGQQTHWVYSCLNQYNEVDLAVPGCQLPH